LHRIERLGRVDLRRDFPDRGNRRIRVSGEAHHDIQVNAILVTMSEGDPGLLQIGREQFRLGLSFESVLTHVGHDSDHFARTASGLLIRHDPFPDRIFENYGRFLKRQAKTKLDQAAGLAKNGRREQHGVNDPENVMVAAIAMPRETIARIAKPGVAREAGRQTGCRATRCSYCKSRRHVVVLRSARKEQACYGRLSASGIACPGTQTFFAPVIFST
jgi:hypothetical protein